MVVLGFPTRDGKWMSIFFIYIHSLTWFLSEDLILQIKQLDLYRFVDWFRLIQPINTKTKIQIQTFENKSSIFTTGSELQFWKFLPSTSSKAYVEYLHKILALHKIV